VEICNDPNMCHLNVNSFLYNKKGPYSHEYTCLDKSSLQVNSKVRVKEECATEDLQEMITADKIIEEQSKDEVLCKIIEGLNTEKVPNSLRKYKMRTGILTKQGFDNKLKIVVPVLLIPIIMSLFHYPPDAGALFCLQIQLNLDI